MQYMTVGGLVDGCGPWQVKTPMLRDAIVAFQQFITIYVNEYRCIDDHVASATKVLGILWASNRDSKRVCYKEVRVCVCGWQSLLRARARTRTGRHISPVQGSCRTTEHPGASALSCRVLMLHVGAHSREQFYNDAINELVDFTEDFSRWKDTQRCSFSFCAHPFVLDPGTKSKLLQVCVPTFT